MALPPPNISTEVASSDSLPAEFLEPHNSVEISHISHTPVTPLFETFQLPPVELPPVFHLLWKLEAAEQCYTFWVAILSGTYVFCKVKISRSPAISDHPFAVLEPFRTDADNVLQDRHPNEEPPFSMMVLSSNYLNSSFLPGSYLCCISNYYGEKISLADIVAMGSLIPNDILLRIIYKTLLAAKELSDAGVCYYVELKNVFFFSNRNIRIFPTSEDVLPDRLLHQSQYLQHDVPLVATESWLPIRTMAFTCGILIYYLVTKSTTNDFSSFMTLPVASRQKRFADCQVPLDLFTLFTELTDVDSYFQNSILHRAVRHRCFVGVRP